MTNKNKFLTTLFSAVVAFSLFTGTAFAMMDGSNMDHAKVVVQISSNDVKAQKRTLKRVGWIMDATVEVVGIGPAFGMFSKDGALSKTVKKLMDRGVVFTADASIQKMMKMHDLPTDLVDGVQHVKVGPAHIVKRQMQGYKYLALFF